MENEKKRSLFQRILIVHKYKMSDRGSKFYKEAEAALTKFRLFDKKGKYTEAADLFTKAGNAYKSVRDFAKAGDAFSRAATCWQAVDELNDAAYQSAEAGRMFAKQPETSEKAIESFRFAAQNYRENAKFSNAAKILVEASQTFREIGEIDKAVDALKDAAQLYDDENQPVQSSTQLAVVGDLLSQKKDWLEAAKIYKDVATRRMGDRLTQLSAGEYFTKSVACQMAADDSIGGENMLREFVNLNPGWERTRDCQLLQKTLKAMNDNDVEAFTSALAEYDQVKRLDSWMIDTFTAIKKLIEGDDEDLC